MDIKIEYSTNSLFGDASGADFYDEAASCRQFENELKSRLAKEYPQARIIIQHGIIDRHSVDGQTDHDECPWIGQVINDAWQSWAWLVPIR